MISFPHTVGTVSSTVLILAGGVGPAVVIVLVCLIFVPGPTVPKNVPKGLIWKRKLWEWFTGWLGLAMSCAATWLITSGLKNLIGKPRPDLIARCMPDMDRFTQFAVTGYPITPANAALVSAGICSQPDQGILDDGWRSWPSGHSSFSAAGLVYLSLFLASKLAITIPFLSPRMTDAAYNSAFPSRLNSFGPGAGAEPLVNGKSGARHTDTGLSNPRSMLSRRGSNLDQSVIAARNESASPPVYLLVIAFIPTAAAMYIAATRYPDFRHQGFDIISGFTIGTVCAIFAFRYYHLPISRGAGWSWGPRSRSRAFWAGVGVGSYVGDPLDVRHKEDDYGRVTRSDTVEMDDLEAGPVAGGSGVHSSGDAGYSRHGPGSSADYGRQGVSTGAGPGPGAAAYVLGGVKRDRLGRNSLEVRGEEVPGRNTVGAPGSGSGPGPAPNVYYGSAR
jgi:membrane-associated phospholipid phosphatase